MANAQTFNQSVNKNLKVLANYQPQGQLGNGMFEWSDVGAVARNIGGSLVGGVLSTAESLSDPVLAAYYTVTGQHSKARDTYLNSWSQTATDYLRGDDRGGKTMQFFNNIAQGVGEQGTRLAISLGLAGIVNPAITQNILLGASAFGSGMQNAVQTTGELGLKEHVYGIGSALIEFGTEKLSDVAGLYGGSSKTIGGVLGLLNVDDWTSKLLGQYANTVGGKLARTFMGEFGEEALSEILNVPLSRLTIDENASTSLKDVLAAGLQGGIVGAIMGGGQEVFNKSNYTKKGQQYVDNAESAQQLIAEGKEVGNDYATYLQNRLNAGAQVTATQYGKLAYENEAKIMQNEVADIKEKYDLTEKEAQKKYYNELAAKIEYLSDGASAFLTEETNTPENVSAIEEYVNKGGSLDNLEVASRIASKRGNVVNYVYDTKDPEGKTESGNVVTINLASDKFIGTVAIHEAIHTLGEDKTAKMYEAIKTTEWHKENADRITKQYEEAYKDRTNKDSLIQEEIVARYMEQAINNPRAFLKSLEGKSGIADEVIAYFKGYNKYTKNLSKADKKTLNGVYNEYLNALKEEKSERKTIGNREVMYDLPFSRQVDLALANQLGDNTDLIVNKNTPQIYQDLGLNDLPMLMTQKHLRDINHAESPANNSWHGLDVNLIKQVPDAIETPAIVMESISPKGNNNSIVVVTNLKDASDRPVVVAIQADGSGIYNSIRYDSNFVKSFYGRNGFMNYLNDNIAQNTILFVDKKRSQRLFRDLQVQFPQGLNNLSFDTIIRKANVKVNQNSKNILASDINSGKVKILTLPMTDSDGNKLTDKQREYFNDSKVVDDYGRLLAVYHGTNDAEVKETWNAERGYFDTEYEPFTVFKKKWDGQVGHFFSKDIDNAGGYGSRVYKCYLNIKNPLVIDCKNATYSNIVFNGMSKDTYGWAEYAKSKKYDGVIFKNIRDGVDYGAMEQSTDEYVVFQSNQIKYTDNTAPTWRSDIRYSLPEKDYDKVLDKLDEFDSADEIKEYFGNVHSYINEEARRKSPKTMAELNELERKRVERVIEAANLEKTALKEWRKAHRKSTALDLSTKAKIEEVDKKYQQAIADNDLDTARDLVEQMALLKGYAVTDYRMDHKAPYNNGYDARLDDVSSVFGDDIYTNNAARYFGTYEGFDNESVKHIQEAKGNPNKKVVVYRAVPRSVKGDQIRNGDWITLTYDYAKNHGESNIIGPYRIIKKTVKASDIYTDGNSIHEFGYDDGKNYYYGDTTNYRKLADVITFDDEGNPIRLRDRFNNKVDDVRYSINEGVYDEEAFADSRPGETEKKDPRSQKIYSKREAKAIINDALKGELERYYGLEFDGKKGELTTKLWEAFNKTPEKNKLGAAMKIAEYIVDKAVLDETDYDIKGYEAQRLKDFKDYKNAFNLNAIKKEIKYRYDTAYPAIMRQWHNGSPVEVDFYGGFDRYAQQISDEFGFNWDTVNAMNATDMFFEFLDEYEKAKEVATKKIKTEAKALFSENEYMNIVENIANKLVEGYDLKGKKDALTTQRDINAALKAEIKELSTKIRYAEAEKNVSMQIQNLTQSAKEFAKRKYSSQAFSGEEAQAVNAAFSKVVVRNKVNSDNAVAAIAVAKNFYTPERINGTTERETFGLYNQGVREDIEYLSETLESGKNLTFEQLKTLNNVMKAVTHVFRSIDTIIYDGKRRHTAEVASTAIAEQRALPKPGKTFKGMRFFITNSCDPLAVFRFYNGYDDNATLIKLYNDIRNGETTTVTTQLEIMRPFDDFNKEHKKYAKRLGTATVELTVTDKAKGGVSKQNIPLDTAMQLYLTSKREHAKEGLFKAGFTFSDDKGFHRFVATEEAIADMYESFTEEDRQYIELAREFFNKTCRDIKAAKDVELFGFTNIEDGDNYIPIRRDDGVFASPNFTMAEAMRDFQTVNSLSMNKNTVKGTKSAIAMQGLWRVVSMHAKQISLYNGLYQPIMAFTKVWDRNVTGDSTNVSSVKVAIKDRTGDNKFDIYVSDLLKGVQGNAKVPQSQVIAWLRSSYAKFQLGANLKTMAIQTSSYPMAMLYIKPKYLLKAAKPTLTKAEVYKYCPFLEVRASDNQLAKAQGVIDDVKGFGDLLLKPIGAIDDAMTRRIFEAACYEVAESSGREVFSDENMKEAAKLAEKTVRETQANALTSEKTAMMRSGSDLVKSLVMFSSDGSKQISRIVDAVGAYNMAKRSGNETALKEAKETLNRCMGTVTTSVAACTLIGLLVKHALGRDDEKTFMQEYFNDFFGQWAGMIPVMRDAYTYFSDGFEVSNFAVDSINNIYSGVNSSIKTLNRVINGETLTNDEIVAPLKKVIFAAGQISGIPTRNLINQPTYFVKKWFLQDDKKQQEALFGDAFNTNMFTVKK